MLDDSINLSVDRKRGKKGVIQYSKEKLLSFGGREIRSKTREQYAISIKERKRGKRGGIKQRIRRTGKTPLPTIILSNLHSIRNKIDNIAALCKFDNDYKNSNLLCFTETWLSETDTNKSIEIENFTVH